jgi:hypothetical protein
VELSLENRVLRTVSHRWPCSSGWLGTSYLAFDVLQARDVVVKEYCPQSIAVRSLNEPAVVCVSERDRDAFAYGLQRFMEQSDTCAVVRNHPCLLVTPDDVCRANGTGYQVWPYLEGRFLTEYLATNGPCLSYDVQLG